MKRSHRSWHRLMWLLLGPLSLVIVVLAWTAREPIPKQATLDAETGLGAASNAGAEALDDEPLPGEGPK